MKEYSFILLKPDAINNKKIVCFINENLKLDNLHICEERNIILTPNDISTIWHFTLRDPISNYLLIKYLSNKKLKLFLIEGEKAIKKICDLKRRTRQLFAKNFLENCFHAPKNKNEYIKDTNFLLYHINGICEEKGISDTSKFIRFSLLNESDFNDCAKKIYDKLQNNLNFKSTILKRKSKKHTLYLLNDNIHEIIYVVAAIYEFIMDFPLYRAYLTCIYADAEGEAILYSSNNIEEIKLIYKSLEGVGINIRVENNDI